MTRATRDGSVRRDERERLEVEALLTDRYLESLFASLDRHAVAAPADVDLEPDVRAAAQVLAAELDRVHPSFRFEERLAARLQEVAAQLRAGGRERGRGRDPVRRWAGGAGHAGASGGHGRSVGVDRPLLIGGALTSAALSVAGAYVAWRRGRAAGTFGQAAVRWRARSVRRTAADAWSAGCSMQPSPPAAAPAGGLAEHAEAQPSMPIRLPFRPRRDSFPADLWTQAAPSCEEMLFNRQLDKVSRVCPTCGHHFRLPARERARRPARPGQFA